MGIIKSKNGWLVKINIQGITIQKYFKDKNIAEIVYQELKKKQELSKIITKLKGIDKELANFLGQEFEKGQFIKLKIFWSVYYKWLITHKKPSTIRERVVRYRTVILPLLGEKTLKEITPEVIQKLQEKLLTKGQSPTSINRCVAIIRHILTIATKLGYLKEHPLKNKIEMLKEKPKREWTFITKEEYEKILTALPQTYKPLFIFLVHTGARLGEALSLKWKDIIWNAGIAYLRDSKANKPRVIYLPDIVLNMLKEKKNKEKINEEDRIFQHSDSRFRKAFKTTLKNLGLRDIRIHDLRHTFASWLALNGVPIQQIQELLGHSDIRTTMRYAHLNPNTLRQTLNKVFSTETYQATKIIHFSEYLKKKNLTSCSLTISQDID